MCPICPLLINPSLDGFSVCLPISLKLEAIRSPHCSLFGVGPIVWDLYRNIEVSAETVFRLVCGLLWPDGVARRNRRRCKLGSDVFDCQKGFLATFLCVSKDRSSEKPSYILSMEQGVSETRRLTKLVGKDVHPRNRYQRYRSRHSLIVWSSSRRHSLCRFEHQRR
jgi:hypothetical protein